MKPKRITYHEILLDRARYGAPRPHPKKEQNLYKAFRKLTRSDHRRFDPSFRSEIESIRPDWFEARPKALPKIKGPSRREIQHAARRERILNLARSGAPRPARKQSVYQVLLRLISPQHRDHDPALTLELHGLRPDWFAVRTKRTKPERTSKATIPTALQTAILDLARSGASRPTRADLPLYDCLRYVENQPSEICRKVLQELQSLRPDWFAARPEALPKPPRERKPRIKVEKVVKPLAKSTRQPDSPSLIPDISP
jgi:hypothetical protein